MEHKIPNILCYIQSLLQEHASNKHYLIMYSLTKVIQASIDHYSRKPRIGIIFLKNRQLEVVQPSLTSKQPKLAKQLGMYDVKKLNPKYIEVQTIYKKQNTPK